MGRLLRAFMLIQVLASAITALLLEERFEWRVGTMSVGGGELAGIFPLLGFGFALGWYLYVNRSLGILLIAVSFGLIGYASGKRVIYLLFPVMTIVNGVLYLALRKQRRQNLF